jgi:hypothetical protein
VNKIFRLLGYLVLFFFVLEVFEPSTIFVRADVPQVSGSVVVFSLHRVHHHRHANSLIRPEQQKKSGQSSRDESHKRQVFSHYATVPVRCLAAIVSASTPCEPRALAVLNSLPPCSDIRPPSLS